MHTADADLTAGAVMHTGLVSCSPDTPLRTVARMLSTYRVHAILVHPHDGNDIPGVGPWGIVSDVDVLRASQSADLDLETAGDVAAAHVAAVTAPEPLGHAVRVMVERGVSHVVVVDPGSARPIGVLSSLDVVRALAGFPETHPVVPA